MGLNKDQMIFDPTESDNDNVGAYLRSSDGTLLTHTTNGGKESLDVHIAGSDVALEVDLDHANDSVKVGDGTDFLAVNADGSINITDNGGSLTVDATDLDIRDLAFATDSVTAHQGGTWTIDSITNPVTVTATDLDIRDLSHVSDSVKIGDGVEFLTIESDGSINVNTNPAGLDSCANPNAVTVTTTATQLVASPLSNRSSVLIQNVGGKEAYLGCDNGVTAAKGIKLPKGASIELGYSEAVNLHAITSAGSTEFRILEGAA